MPRRLLNSVAGMNPFEAYIEALTATSIETLRHFNLDTALAAGMAPHEGVRFFVCGGLVYK